MAQLKPTVTPSKTPLPINPSDDGLTPLIRGLKPMDGKDYYFDHPTRSWLPVTQSEILTPPAPIVNEAKAIDLAQRIKGYKVRLIDIQTTMATLSKEKEQINNMLNLAMEEFTSL